MSGEYDPGRASEEEAKLRQNAEARHAASNPALIARMLAASREYGAKGREPNGPEVSREPGEEVGEPEARTVSLEKTLEQEARSVAAKELRDEDAARRARTRGALQLGSQALTRDLK